jgi:hypothetical protein
MLPKRERAGKPRTGHAASHGTRDIGAQLRGPTQPSFESALDQSRGRVPESTHRATAGGWSKMSDEPLARERGARFTAHAGGPRAQQASKLEARLLLSRSEGGTVARAGGTTCAMPNGRCKLHGGKSTGPRTPEGLERSRRANWKHGHFSREAKAERSRVRAALLVIRYLRDSI